MKVLFWVTAVLGGLALALTLSGLFSVLSFLVAQRTTEIGVRVALGATPLDVVSLVLSQSFGPVLIGLVAGAGFAGALATAIMSTSAREIGDTVRAFDPVAFIASLGVIVTACALAALIPARRAARIDPIEALRRN